MTDSTTYCPLAYSLCLFGDRWSLLILRDMILFKKHRYSDFLSSPEAISTNILAARLQQLARQGLIEKYRDPENAKSNIYILSEKGISLLPVIMAIVEWGIKDTKPLPMLVEIVVEYKKDREAYNTRCIDALTQQRNRQLLELQT